MIIRPKQKTDDRGRVGSVRKAVMMVGVIALVIVAGIIIYVEIKQSSDTVVVVAEKTKEVPSVTADVKKAAPSQELQKSSVASAQSVAPYPDLKSNPEGYKARQADELRRQLDSARARGELDSLTLSEERIRKLEKSGNAVW